MTLKLAVVLLALALAASLLARRRDARKPPRRAVESATQCPACGAWIAPGARCDCRDL